MYEYTISPIVAMKSRVEDVPKSYSCGKQDYVSNECRNRIKKTIKFLYKLLEDRSEVVLKSVSTIKQFVREKAG